MKNELEVEKASCNEMHDNLVKTFGEEILKLSEILSEEKQIREQQHNNMLRILEDLNDSLATSLKKENDERNQQEEMMLKLLEETCAKIEESLTNWFLKLDGIDCTLSFFKIIIIICESVLMRLA